MATRGCQGSIVSQLRTNTVEGADDAPQAVQPSQPACDHPRLHRILIVLLGGFLGAEIPTASCGRVGCDELRLAWPHSATSRAATLGATEARSAQRLKR